MDDPSGNSFLEGRFGQSDDSLKVEHYQRTREQDVQLGIAVQEDGKAEAQVETGNVRNNRDSVVIQT